MSLPEVRSGPSLVIPGRRHTGTSMAENIVQRLVAVYRESDHDRNQTNG